MTAQKIGLPWKHFISIFPLQADDIFTTTQGLSTKDATVHMLLQCLTEFLPPTEFSPPTEVHDGHIDLHFQAEESGSIFAILKYPCPSPQKNNIIALTGEVFLGSATEDSIAFLPHFIMTGHQQQAKETPVFVPQTLLGKVIHSDFGNEPKFLEFDTSTTGDVSEALCYAEDCLRQILAGTPLKVERSQEWIEADDPTLDQRIDYITSRSLSDFRKEIAKLKAAEQIRRFNAFEFPTPAGLQ